MKLAYLFYPLIALVGTAQAQVLYPSDVERIKAIYAAEQAAAHQYALQNAAPRSLSPTLGMQHQPSTASLAPMSYQNYQPVGAYQSAPPTAVRPYPAYAQQLVPSAQIQRAPTTQFTPAQGYNPYRITPANPILTANTYTPYQQNRVPNPYRPQMTTQNFAAKPKPKPKVHAWGIERHIWPDFYTDFTDEAWDWMMRSPRDLGYMPGGWRFPYVSMPDPVTVSDAVANQIPPIIEEVPNFAPTP
jgi:hypothetical protein